jgi:hypothetical protein
MVTNFFPASIITMFFLASIVDFAMFNWVRGFIYLFSALLNICFLWVAK